MDFSAEMERVLQVLDYAVVIINALDGIQSHTETIWKLLQHYHVPALVFVNKMDVSHTERTQIMEDLKRHLDEHCVDVTLQDEACQEQLAMCSDELLESYMETGGITDEQLADAVAQRTIFPCCFGSALKMEGIQEFLDMLNSCTKAPAIAATLVLLNIEHFQRINHRYGMQLGDEVLCQVYKVLCQHLDANEFMAREEGDSFFLFLLTQDTSLLQNRIDEIQKDIHKQTENLQSIIRLRQGACLVDGTQKDVDLLINRAKLALRQYVSGKGCVFYDAALEENDVECALAGIEATEQFFKEIGMPTSIHEMGIALGEEDIRKLAWKCSFEDERTIGCFKVLKKEDMENIYRIAK